MQRARTEETLAVFEDVKIFRLDNGMIRFWITNLGGKDFPAAHPIALALVAACASAATTEDDVYTIVGQ